MPPLTLHTEAFWMSPWDFSAFVALREKGLAFGAAIIQVAEGMDVLDRVAEHSITRGTPLLQHGDFWVAASLAINEYLEDSFPPPSWPRLFPEDLRERARAREVMSWLRTAQRPLQRERPTQVIFYPDSLPPLSDAGARAAAELIGVAERLGCAAVGHLFGRFTIVDAELAFALMRLVRTRHAVPDPVRAFAEAVWTRPSVREFVEHPRPPHPPWPLARYLR